MPVVGTTTAVLGEIVLPRAMPIITEILDRRLMWASIVPTPGAFTICMEMSGNGAKIGLDRMLLIMSLTRAHPAWVLTTRSCGSAPKLIEVVGITGLSPGSARLRGFAAPVVEKKIRLPSPSSRWTNCNYPKIVIFRNFANST